MTRPRCSCGATAACRRGRPGCWRRRSSRPPISWMRSGAKDEVIGAARLHTASTGWTNPSSRTCDQAPRTATLAEGLAEEVGAVMSANQPPNPGTNHATLPPPLPLPPPSIYQPPPTEHQQALPATAAYPGAPQAVTGTTSGQAKWSLWLGVFSCAVGLGLVCWVGPLLDRTWGTVWILLPIAFLTACAATVCGQAALGQIRRSGGQIGGRRMARTGLFLGYLFLAATIIAALLFIAWLILAWMMFTAAS